MKRTPHTICALFALIGLINGAQAQNAMTNPAPAMSM